MVGMRKPIPGDVDVRPAVEAMLADAMKRGASDIHLEPTAAGYALRYRVDGLLREVDPLDPETGRAYVNRLMVAAKLLTYRLDVPQEGRLSHDGADLRLAVMPTNHGLRVVLRLPAELVQPRRLDQLDLPAAVMRGLESFATTDSGMLLLCGPAGSGKTTTIYALLEHLATRDAGISVVSLEDPIERDLPGVTQIEVQPFGELTYERALRSMLRQDPQVLAVGEVRDAATASIAVQAALTGHRLVTTLHAASADGALVRLLEMGIEPYQVAGSVAGVVTMRLLRRTGGNGYAGRVPVASYAAMDEAVRRAVLAGDTGAIAAGIAEQPGYDSLRAVAGELVDRGVTDASEVRRVLGETLG